MYLGKQLFIKYEGKIIIGNVEKIFPEDLDIRLDNGEIIRRKFWEVREVINDEKK